MKNKTTTRILTLSLFAFLVSAFIMFKAGFFDNKNEHKGSVVGNYQLDTNQTTTDTFNTTKPDSTGTIFFLADTPKVPYSAPSSKSVIVIDQQKFLEPSPPLPKPQKTQVSPLNKK